MVFILNRRHAINYLATHTYFTQQALEVIADYLSETDTDREVDPTQLACEWIEATQLTDLVHDYNHVEGFPTDIHDDEAIIAWFTKQTLFLTFQHTNSTHYVLQSF